MPANLTIAFGQQGCNGDQGTISLACKVFATWTKSKLTSSEGRLRAIATKLEMICKEKDQQVKDRSFQASFSAPGATETEYECTTDDDGEEDLDYSSDDS
jgi:hypothetical protein